MPIDSLHADYAAIVARARRMRDAIEGQERVHAAGTAYLPRLTEQTQEEYTSYLLRAGWYGATGRTHEGMVGMVFRRPAVLDAPPGIEDITGDINLAGESLDGFTRNVLAEVLATARSGVLVEHPSVQQDVQSVTVAQAQSANLRPYATLYTSESIINWRVERVNNAMRLTLVVLSEIVCEADPEDPYRTNDVQQYRALLLEDGRYVQRVYRKSQSEKFEPGADIVPLRNGAPLDHIPFYPFGPTENSMRAQRPPMQQLADVNFGHYRNTADLEHGAHFAGLPTPWVAGAQLAEGASVALGSPTAIVFPDPAGKAGFLEFTGTGLGALEKRCEVKEQQMAALGARMLAPEKTGVEAGATLAMRHTGESSVLAGIANLVSAGMTAVLLEMAAWAQLDGAVTYALNTDFMPEGLTAQELTALVQAWQAGGISWETFFANLKAGEIVAPDVTPEDEKSRIDAAGPPLGTMPPQDDDPSAGGGSGDGE